MTRALRLTVACLVAASVGGCSTGQLATPSTLAPLTVPRGQPVRGVTLRDPAALIPAQALVATDSDGSDTPVGGASGFDQYPTMLWMLTASGVLDEIGAQPVTILAPSEEAFRNFEFVDFYGLMTNPVAMAPILRQHVVLGLYDTDELGAAVTVTTLAGSQLEVWLNGRQIMVNEATVTPPVTDGAGVAKSVVYGINRLLLPAGNG